MRLFTLAAAALAALLLTIALANAQEPPEPQTATRLEPGINLIGWVGEPTSVSQLFREIPQLEAIWAWDAELDDWVAAGRDAPEWSSGLRRVAAGMGLGLVLGGDQPFTWERSTEPTRGLVELRSGWNLVAWSGADGAPLEQVAKGIGWSLRELRRWDAANQRWTTWTSPERSTQLIAASTTDQGATDEESEPVAVQRGEALWVNVARSVNWLQPTDILPRLVFPGGASDELQARVREDLEAVLAFYGQQYGIQADPDFTVYVAKDIEVLIQAQKDDGDEIDDARAASIRALWNRVGGWAGEEVVVKQALWPEDLPTSDVPRARYTLTHEYFHILQTQMSDGWASQWLIEGTATWTADDHQAIDGSGTWEDAREGRVSAVTEGTPSLRSTESDNATWEYTLGWLAVDRLTKVAGGGSYIEFWRRLASTEIGPHGRWTSTPDWRTAFQETFGLPVSSFYADFDAWQQEQAATNGATVSADDDDAHWIRGRVTDESGAVVAGVFVNAIRVEGETSVGWNQRAETDADGAFAVRAPEDGDYRISVDVTDNCTGYYGDGALINLFLGSAPPREWPGALSGEDEPDDEVQLVQPVTVDGSDLRGVNIRLPSDICGWLIHGRAVNHTGEPLSGVSVQACPATNGDCTWGRTTFDGSFAVPVPVTGTYRLLLNLNFSGCSVYYRTGRLTTSYADASLINVTGIGSPNLQLHVPEDLCPREITGQILRPNGLPLAGKYVQVRKEVDGRGVWQDGRHTDTYGWFAITSAGDGDYSVNIPNLDGCSIWFHASGFASNWYGRSTFHIRGNNNARLGSRQIPVDLCAHQIKGRLVDVNGAPVAAERIDAFGPGVRSLGPSDSSSAAWPDSTGQFAIRVPADGPYSFGVQLRPPSECRYYHFERRIIGSPGNPVRVSGADVTGVELRLPGTVEELCG